MSCLIPERSSADRFLGSRMKIALAAYALFAATFSLFQVKGDGLVYYNFLRRYFGEHPDFAFAYQFGSDLWNAPFFLTGKALGAIFGSQPQVFHVTFEEIAITLATNAAFVLTLYLGWRILRELALPRGPAVLFLTTFGSPLFYYVVFDPAAKHAVDTLVLTGATYIFLRAEATTTMRQALALGALAGVAVNTRYVNVAFFGAFALTWLLRGRARQAGLGAATAYIVAVAVYALPALRGIPYFQPSYFPKSHGVVRLAAPAGHPLALGGGTRNLLNGFDVLNPLRMLFSLHRGLFIWTPLTALAVVGFALAVRDAQRDGRHRLFYWTLTGGALALLCIHVIWGQWDGGFAFSQRFLTGLFPLYLIGVAELVRRARRIAYPFLALTVAWALAIAFVHNIGYDGVSQRDGIDRVVDAGYANRHNLRIKIQNRAEDRWVYLWGLLHGEDSKHLHDPFGTPHQTQRRSRDSLPERPLDTSDRNQMRFASTKSWSVRRSRPRAARAIAGEENAQLVRTCELSSNDPALAVDFLAAPKGSATPTSARP